MRCSSCYAAVDVKDNFCRNCGDSLSRSLLPVASKTGPLAKYRPPGSAALWRGAAVILAGKALEFALRKIVERRLSSALSKWQDSQLPNKPAVVRPRENKRVLGPSRVIRTIIFWQQSIEE